MDATTTADGTLVLSGRLDGRTTADVRALLYERMDGMGDVVLDLSEVDSVDITALRMLAAAGAVLDRQGRLLVLRGCRPAVRRIVAMTRMRALLHLEPVNV